MKRALLLMFATMAAQAAVTTVTQSVVGPDGLPTAGTAVIRISAACRSGSTYVGVQTITVKFTAATPSGKPNNFNVGLVPNDTCVVSGPTPAAWSSGTAYNAGASVSYNGQAWLAIVGSTGVTPGSDSTKWALVSTSYSVSWTLVGGQAWTETWIIPTSGTPISVDSVKVAQANLPTVAAVIMSGGSGGITYTTPIQDGQYIRWNASMNAYQPVTFVDQETVGGTVDGVNAVFTLAAAPSPPGGLVLFRNGMAQKAGGFDYTLSGNTITFVDAAIPQPGDTLIAWYRY